MIDLIDNPKLLHTYHLFECRDKKLGLLGKTKPYNFAHPLKCEWCNKVWLYKRKCCFCHTEDVYLCQKHIHMDNCETCLHEHVEKYKLHRRHHQPTSVKLDETLT